MTNILLDRGVSWGIAIAFLSAAVLAFSFITLRSNEAPKDWPTTTGKLHKSNLEKTILARAKTSSGTSLGPLNITHEYESVWEPKVRYEFTVDGKQYWGSNATSILKVESTEGASSAPSQDFINFFSPLQPGSSVEVHYNPNNPTESYLIFIEDQHSRKVCAGAISIFFVGLLIATACRVLADK